jgi:hypothetical protein
MATKDINNFGTQKAASPQTYNNLKSGPAKSLTPDEEQTLAQTPRISWIYKGALTRSSIYERLYPDGQTASLRIDGPGDSFIALGNQGTLTLVTGRYSKEVGAGSGRLNIHTYGGQQQKHDERSNFEYNAGTDPEKQAINVMAYGDVVEEARGGERHIRATKIVISAAEELILAGQTVTIQANSGSGSIQMFAGNVEQTTANKKDIVAGQVMKFGVSEESTIQFDPRGSVNWVSPGHVNWKVLGDYQQWVGGAFQQVVTGGLPVPPLIKARDNIYSVKTTGAQSYTSSAGIFQVAGAGISQIASGVISSDAGGSVTIKAGGSFSANAGADASMTAGGIANVTAAGNINVIGVGNINITGTGNVRIKGALIYLN